MGCALMAAWPCWARGCGSPDDRAGPERATGIACGVVHRDVVHRDVVHRAPVLGDGRDRHVPGAVRAWPL
jgi:hypothetical protein